MPSNNVLTWTALVEEDLRDGSAELLRDHAASLCRAIRREENDASGYQNTRPFLADVRPELPRMMEAMGVASIGRPEQLCACGHKRISHFLSGACAVCESCRDFYDPHAAPAEL